MSKADYTHTWMEYGVHYASSTVECFGDVDAALASRVVKGLFAVDQQSKPITLWLSTGGGEETAGMAIYDAVERCKNPVTIIGTGQVMSMGVLILQAGDERLLTPNCEVMLHEGSLEVPQDHKRNAQAYVKDMAATDRRLDLILLARIREAHPRYTLKQLTQRQMFDCYLSATEAVELGLAQGIYK